MHHSYIQKIVYHFVSPLELFPSDDKETFCEDKRKTLITTAQTRTSRIIKCKGNICRSKATISDDFCATKLKISKSEFVNSSLKNTHVHSPNIKIKKELTIILGRLTSFNPRFNLPIFFSKRKIYTNRHTPQSINWKIARYTAFKPKYKSEENITRKNKDSKERYILGAKIIPAAETSINTAKT